MAEKTINILSQYKDKLFYDKITFSEAIDRQKQGITGVQCMSLTIFFEHEFQIVVKKDEILYNIKEKSRRVYFSKKEEKDWKKVNQSDRKWTNME